ncbi:MerR family transcriptional regulator [Listeria cornellensis]|uniref:GlnR/MerR family transcription regulator n=1 Tax=Listeria cornellensis FSL F6-0969 TaxID=1265820 RepID=W7BFQ8_9LIST|nr:MerR family transcriptional regulator [Listeria cornellensis]EUJ25949.1 GlnR/MerR family transcription regulator [Listeria cornellensis FSL F6-0969]
MYRIGEFAEMTGLTKETLRYYAQIELLTPVFVEPRNKYSYYDNNSFLVARLLVYLRRFDFSIQEMLMVVHDRSLDELEEILKEKKVALRQQIVDTEAIISEIDGFLEMEE